MNLAWGYENINNFFLSRQLKKGFAQEGFKNSQCEKSADCTDNDGLCTLVCFKR